MNEVQDDAGEHRRQRELLGSFLLDQLSTSETTAVQAHLDGCAGCRAELSVLAPLAADLRTVDPEALSTPATPPPDLGGRIRDAVRVEQVLLDLRRRRTTVRQGSLAAIAAVALMLGGVGLGQALIPRTQVVVAQPVAPGPYEPITATRIQPGLAVTKAGVVPHTWGLEVKMEGSGFATGQPYRAVVVGRDGRSTPAGEFLGTGARTLKCNMQSAMLRQDATRFVVMDARGLTVLTAGLKAIS